jgi:hypothetical protein
MPMPMPMPAPAPAPALESEPETEPESMVDSDRLCVVCLERAKEITLVHKGTGHMCCCSPCADALQAAGQPCPLCREPFEAIIRTFV